MRLLLLIAGTDTGVGKTRVGTALAGALVRRGLRVRALKPIESGCDGPPTEAEDGVRLARATGQPSPVSALIRLKAPLAPPLAADLASRPLCFAEILGLTKAALDPDAALTLIEGAGGLLSPLAWDGTALDLALAMGASLVLVAPNRLGALSHCRLALSVLKANGVHCVGIVLSAIAEPDDASPHNASSLARLEPSVPIWEFPREATEDAAIAAASGLADDLINLGRRGPP